MDRWQKVKDNPEKYPNIILNELPKGYLGLQMLNGYSHTQPEGPIRNLTHAIDLWIESNTDLIKQITVSPKFYHALTKEVGYKVTVVDSLVGEAALIIDPMQNEEVKVL